MAVPLMAGNGGLWLSFALPVLVLLALDIGLFLKSPREPTMKESLAWTAVWAALAGVFGIALTAAHGPRDGLSFFTAYVVEQALSIDNLFVFLLVFGELGVNPAARKRPLAWGVLGALVLRIGMLAAGGAFLARFHVVGWALGALLVVTGVRAAMKLLREESAKQADPDHDLAIDVTAGTPGGDSGATAHSKGLAAGGWGVAGSPRAQMRGERMLMRWFPIHDHFDGDRFVTEVGGRTYGTPLLVALVTILCADVVFAVDSIPAVLGISTNPIVVVTSNVFAVLGLRSMFFLLSGLLSRLKYLPHGLAAVLVVVGAKMLLGSFVAIPTWLSLFSVLSVLGVAVLRSLRVSPTDSVLLPSSPKPVRSPSPSASPSPSSKKEHPSS